MALPTLDATFASSADLPRKQMLAKWLVEEQGGSGGGGSSILVSGAGASLVNGTYVPFSTNTISGVTFTIWTKDGGDSFPRIRAESVFGDNYLFYIRTGNSQSYQGRPSAGAFFQTTSPAYSPINVGYWEATGGAQEPLPTLSEPTQSSGQISDYYSLPERYLWAKIAVAAGAPKTEATYISLPTRYVWSDIYNAISGSSGSRIDWSENVALGHIAAAYRGDTENPANLATYIDWPWRYKVASIISHLATPTSYNAVIVSGAGTSSANGIYTYRGENEGKPYYNFVGFSSDPYADSIVWTPNGPWTIFVAGDGLYFSEEGVAFPWLVENWTIADGSPPAPTLTPTNV